MMTRSFDVTRLATDEVCFRRLDDTLTLSLQNGRYYPRVEVRRCFPMSEDSRYISVRDATTEDKDEIGLIEDWTSLGPDDRQAVAEELDQFYFVPRIRRVSDIKEEFGFLYWKIETDKGPMEFVMRDSVMRYTRHIGLDRYVIIDVNRTRYEIEDLAALDAHSQRLVTVALCL